MVVHGFTKKNNPLVSSTFTVIAATVRHLIDVCCLFSFHSWFESGRHKPHRLLSMTIIIMMINCWNTDLPAIYPSIIYYTKAAHSTNLEHGNYTQFTHAVILSQDMRPLILFPEQLFYEMIR